MKKLFLAAAGALYAAFLTLDLLGVYSTLSAGLKYASIVLVLLAGLTALRTRDGKTVAAALLLTATADVFLLLLNRHYAVGILMFLCVQAVYTCRLCALGEVNLTLHLTVRAMLAGFAALFAGARLGRLETLAAAYIVWFFMNLAHSVALAAQARTKRTLRFAAGLALFFLCDLCVGVHNLPPNALSSFAGIAMWMFYLPGQVLIVLSTDCFGGLHETI